MSPVKTRSGCAFALRMSIVLLILGVAACASSSAILKWNQVDRAALIKSEPGKAAYNTIRFRTFGHTNVQHLYGYFLYKDGYEVQPEAGIPVEKLGKMTLQEVLADYQKVLKANMYTGGSDLNVQEYLRRDAVVGYSASDINLEVNIWDVTKGDGPPVLRVVYKDLRLEDQKRKKY